MPPEHKKHHFKPYFRFWILEPIPIACRDTSSYLADVYISFCKNMWEYLRFWKNIHPCQLVYQYCTISLYSFFNHEYNFKDRVNIMT